MGVRITWREMRMVLSILGGAVPTGDLATATKSIPQFHVASKPLNVCLLLLVDGAIPLPFDLAVLYMLGAKAKMACLGWATIEINSCPLLFLCQA